MAARIHTHASNRATTLSKDRKIAFKSALDTPYRVSWPKVPTNIQTELLAHMISILEGVADCHITFRRLSCKRKKASTSDGMQEEKDEAAVEPLDAELQAKIMIDHMVVGLNAVTKRLETQVRKRPHARITEKEPDEDIETKPDLRLILACRADIDPPLLIDHIPHLAATCNSIQKDAVKLASLPAGAEEALAKALGVRRVSVIGLDAEFPALDGFTPFMESIPILSAGWLSRIGLARNFIPTHVKQVKTSVPRDMKEAKEKRKKGRADAKQRKRIKIR
ncbi:hypothetical protein APHAL10511_006006 [Amanita phalloides]|nr:hypothetical protein APHAL10511_006006 [Amanita phalloides]